MVVKHNMEAMNANGQLDIANKSLQVSTQRLSSGYRINKAADDAAGLSISEKMRKQIRGLTRASTNAEDGISLVQTADGALEEVQSMLQRMNELCVQAANGTNSETDRMCIQDEVTQLTTEIDRIATSTKFNEIYLLDGSIEKPGRTEENIARNNQRIEEVVRSYEDFNYSNAELYTYKQLNGDLAGQIVTQSDVDNTSGLKIVYLKDDVITSKSEAGNPTLTDAQYDNLKYILKNELVPNAVLSIMNAYSPAFNFLTDSSIGIGLYLYNDTSTSVLASVGVEASWYYNDDLHTNLAYTLSVNMATLGLDSNGNITEERRNKLEATIIHEMMHAFMDESLTNGMLGIDQTRYTDANEEYPKWFKEGMAQTACGGYYDGNDWVNNNGGNTGLGGLNINKNNNTTAAEVKAVLEHANNKLSSGSTTSMYATGYLACMYLGYLQRGQRLDEANIQAGVSTILDMLRGGYSLLEIINQCVNSMGKSYASVSDFENDFANIASQFVVDLTALVGDGSGGFATGFTKTYDKDVLDDTARTVTLFQLNTENDKVNNLYPDTYDVFSGGTKSARGNQGSINPSGGTVPNGTSGTIPSSGKNGTSGSGTGTGASSFNRAHGNGLAIHVGADSDITNKIFIYIDAMNAESLGISDVDVSTVNTATISIERVALALTQVSTQRSSLGAYQNRLEHTVKNLDNVVENTTASESQIRDTDMTTEMVKYSNASIIAQAGQAMLCWHKPTSPNRVLFHYSVNILYILEGAVNCDGSLFNVIWLKIFILSINNYHKTSDI